MIEWLAYKLTGRTLLPKRDPRDPHCANCGTYLVLDGPHWQYDSAPGGIRARRDLPCRGCQAGSHCRPSGCPCGECRMTDRTVERSRTVEMQLPEREAQS